MKSGTTLLPVSDFVQLLVKFWVCLGRIDAHVCVSGSGPHRLAPHSFAAFGFHAETIHMGALRPVKS